MCGDWIDESPQHIRSATYPKAPLQLYQGAVRRGRPGLERSGA